MACPYCDGDNCNYNSCDGDLVELSGDYAVIRFRAYCDDCGRSFHRNVTYECDGGYRCSKMDGDE